MLARTLGAITLLAATPVSTGPVLEPVTKWSMEVQPDLCVLNRTFAANGIKASFGLRQAPADIQDEIFLLTYGDANRGTRSGRVKMHFTPSGKEIVGAAFVNVPVAGTDQRLARFLIPRSEMGAFDGAETLTISEVGRPPVTMHIPKIGKALDAVLQCEAQFFSDWGVDPSIIKTWPMPIGSMTDWFTFPADANQGVLGSQLADTIVRWMIDDTGHAHDCRVVRSSGNTRLDEAACANIARRARYKPAIGKDGLPKPWLESRRIVWALGQYE